MTPVDTTAPGIESIVARNDRWLRNLLVALVLVGLAMRLAALGERALHHDESLDAWFSQRFYEGTYDGYDPVYHGPLRFYLTAALYWFFGFSVASARLISVLAGTALIALPWFLRRQLGTIGTAVVAAILCFSPSFLYFSRFAREDALFACLSLIFVVVLFAYLDRPRTSTLAALLLTLVAAWAVKESVFLLVMVVGSYLLVELAIELFDRSSLRVAPPAIVLVLAAASILAFALGDPIMVNLGWWGALLLGTVAVALLAARRAGGSFGTTEVGAATLAPGWRGWVSALSAAAIVFVVLFTVWLTNWAGSDTDSTPHNAVIDGLVGGWDYWRSQQDVNRGGEPWYYYLFTIPAYEYVTVFLAGIGVVSELRSSTRIGRFALWSTVVSLGAYSYAGERMPWLVLHPLLPAVLLAGVGAQYLWSHRETALAGSAAMLVVLGALATGFAGFRVNYVDGEEPRELLSQAGQASPELAATVARLYRLDQIVQSERGRPLKVLIDSADSAAWPYVFYVRDLSEVLYADLGTATIDPTTDVVIVVDRNASTVAPAVVGWDATRQLHREWWVPSYTEGGVAGWLRWLTDRELWGDDEVGGVGETVYVSPDVAALETRVEDLLASGRRGD